MLTGAFTAGRMAAPEHLSRRDRVSFTNDHLAVTITNARIRSTRLARVSGMGVGAIVTPPAAHPSRPSVRHQRGRSGRATDSGYPRAGSVPRSDATDA
jgi:hypothetical protein